MTLISSGLMCFTSPKLISPAVWCTTVLAPLPDGTATGVGVDEANVGLNSMR